MSPPLILLGTLQPSYWIGKLNLPQLPEIYSQLKKKSKVPKGKSQMTTAPLTLDWITSPVVPHWQLSSGRAHCGADQWLSRRSTSRYLINSWLLMGGAQGCTVQLLSKTCCLVTGCGVIRHSNGYLLRAVLMLLYYIRILWVQRALIFLIDSFPTSDFDFTCLFNFCTSFFSLYSQTCLSAVLIYMPLQQLPHDYMCRIYYS